MQTQPLAVLLFASAFWSLRRQGVLELYVQDHARNGWLAQHPEVAVKRLNASSRPGLEGAILENLDDCGSLCDIVCRWSAMRSTDPWHDAIHEEVLEAVKGGYMHEVPNNGGLLARLLWRGSEFESDCVRIARLEDEWQDFDRGWRHFQERESRLCGHLTAECKRSLLTCTECWYP